MGIAKRLLAIFFAPGNIVLAKLNVSESEDEGILRSMINMLVWGAICVAIIWPYFF